MVWITTATVRYMRVHKQFQEMVKMFNVTDEDNEGKKLQNKKEKRNKKQLHGTSTSRCNAISRTFSPKQ